MNMRENSLQFKPYRKFDLNDLLKIIPRAYEMYQLPGRPEDVHVCPVSGGADSAFLAIIMHLLFPSCDFQLVFCDTRADDPGIYQTLLNLEGYLNKPITRLVPEKGLFELVDQFNGFLPSTKSRWCTRILKLENFRPWLEQYKGVPKHMYVGIRSDEPTRLAFTIDEVETHMPMVDLGLKREDVFLVLEKTIQIPRLYKRRTRSGCTVCPFQRRSELVGLLQELPDEFQRGSDYEKSDPINDDRHIDAVPLWKDSGIALNWQNLPLPTDELPINGRKPKKSSMSLFGDRGIFVAGEFFMDGFLSNDEFVWHQRVISYSTALAGLKRQVNDRYRHLLATGEVYGLSPVDVRTKARFAIWYLELPENVFDPDPPKGEGYFWQQGSSYKQLKHIINWTTRALNAEAMRQQAAKVAHPLSVQHEWVEASKLGLSKLGHAVGQVVASQWYIPVEKEPDLTEEEELLSLPCPMCHI